MKKKQVKKKSKPLPVSQQPNGSIISNNIFYGVRWDEAAVQSVQTVAEGLRNLSELFKSQNIHVDAMIKIVDNPTVQHDEQKNG